MGECICNSCMNLKKLVNEEANQVDYICEFGFPSENCEDCEGEECNVTECSHYIEDKEVEIVRKVHCKSCGMELQQMYAYEGDGEVFCINCYLNPK